MRIVLISLVAGYLMLSSVVVRGEGAQAAKTPKTKSIAMVAEAGGQAAQAPKQFHLTGAKAFRLISLLASGSKSVNAAIKDSRKKEFVIRDFKVLKAATSKYDPEDAYFNLAIYSARGKVDQATEDTPIGEATALWGLLSGIGVPPDGAMEGSYLALSNIRCRIDPSVSVKAPERFKCDLTNDF